VHGHAEHDHAVAECEQQPNGEGATDAQQDCERDDPLAEKQPHTRHNRHEAGAVRAPNG